MSDRLIGEIGSIPNQIKDQGLLCIPVASHETPFRTRGETPLFLGDLQGFLDIAKKLDARGIYFAVETFLEEEFSYSAPMEGEDAVGEGDLDLATKFPDLAVFKEHVGEPSKAYLSTAGGVAELSFELTEKWALEFEEKRDQILANLEGLEEARQEKEEQEREVKEGELVKIIRQLRNDEKFMHLKTQRAMTNYALEHHLELEELDRGTLKTEIQRLWDIGH